MKKVIAIVLIVVFSLTCLCACVEGEQAESATNTKYQILLNSGSCFVFVFEDPKTGVWYVSTSEGVTPRLNVDGSLYREG